MPLTAHAVVLDIEGTTGPLSFVREQLFPYSRTRIRDLVREPSAELTPLLDEVRQLAGAPTATNADLADILVQWIDQDSKASPLKALQAILWDAGYANGELVARVYDDVPPALEAWTRNGLAVHSYSSGSVRAQRAYYSHTQHGDLLPHFSRLFDTRNAGGKHQPESYRAIADTLAVAPAALLFLSDDPKELQAARAAGWQAIGIQRPDSQPVGAAEDPWVADFEQIRPQLPISVG